MFLTPKQTEAVLREPEFQVYDNPEAFLTCNNDPTQALCHPDRALGGQRDRPPAIDRCDPACSNISRTDQHIPIQRRHRQRISTLQAIVDRHVRSRIVKRGNADD
jgi:hypothetical protein